MTCKDGCLGGIAQRQLCPNLKDRELSCAKAHSLLGGLSEADLVNPRKPELLNLKLKAALIRISGFPLYISMRPVILTCFLSQYP